MSKKSKKRNKKYTGVGSTSQTPVVTRITASNRSRLGQWWFENKKLIKTVATVLIVIATLILIVVEIINIASGKVI
jgi:CHASE3 domain sensor protein